MTKPITRAGGALGVVVVLYVLVPDPTAGRTGLERLAAGTDALDTSGWKPIRMHAVTDGEIDAEPALRAAQPRLRLAVAEVRRAGRSVPAPPSAPLPATGERPGDAEERQGSASWLLEDGVEPANGDVALGRGGWLAERVRNLEAAEAAEPSLRFEIPEEPVFGAGRRDEGLFDSSDESLFPLGGNGYGEESAEEESIFAVPRTDVDERDTGLGVDRGLFAPEGTLR